MFWCRGDQDMGLTLCRPEAFLFPLEFLCSHDDVSTIIVVAVMLLMIIIFSCIREELLAADFSGCMKLLQVRLKVCTH